MALFGDAQNRASHKSAIREDAVQRVGARVERARRFDHVAMHDSCAGEFIFHLAKMSTSPALSALFVAIATARSRIVSATPR